MLARSSRVLRRFLPSLVRWAATESVPDNQDAEPQNITLEPKPSFMDRLRSRFGTHKEKEAALSDVIGTLRSINYRYDFPQGLTEQQKKQLKRFDVFRFAFCF